MYDTYIQYRPNHFKPKLKNKNNENLSWCNISARFVDCNARDRILNGQREIVVDVE